MRPSSILFVCLGNICRSPLAEGIFRSELAKSSLAGDIMIDSAGVGGWHVGNAPDGRASEVASRYGVDISGQVCRQLAAADFENFDLILGMDHENVANCQSLETGAGKAEIAMMMVWAGLGDKEIPDPYYGAGAGDGFERAYQMIAKSSRGIIARIKEAN